jgi:hypothetical protein
MIYSEGVFIALSILTLMMLSRGQYLVAAVLAASLGLVRPSAIVVVLIVMCVSASVFWGTKKFKSFLPIVISPIGMLSYAGYLYFHVGSVDSYFAAQRLGWGESFSLTARFIDLQQLVQWALNGFGWADWNRVVPGLFLVIAIFGLWGCHKLSLPKIWLIYSVGILCTAFFSKTLGVLPRFFLTAFPITLGLTYYLRSQTSRLIATAFTVTALVLYSIVVFGLSYQTP